MKINDKAILKSIAIILKDLTAEQQQQSYCIMYGMKIANELSEKNKKESA